MFWLSAKKRYLGYTWKRGSRGCYIPPIEPDKEARPDDGRCIIVGDGPEAGVGWLLFAAAGEVECASVVVFACVVAGFSSVVGLPIFSGY